jgi:elongation factor Ts
MNPENEEELLKQDYVRDPSQTVETLVKASIGKLGENIKIGRFSRISLGK